MPEPPEGGTPNGLLDLRGVGLMIAKAWFFRGSTMVLIFNLLAQMDPDKLTKLSNGSPTLSESASYGMTWVIALLLTAGILMVTFKTSKRNHMERGE